MHYSIPSFMEDFVATGLTVFIMSGMISICIAWRDPKFSEQCRIYRDRFRRKFGKLGKV